MKVPERGFKRLSNWIKAWQKEIWQFACRVYHTKHSILYNIQLWRGRIRWQVFSFSSYCTKRCTYSQRKKSIQYTYINFASKNKLERLKSKSFPFLLHRTSMFQGIGDVSSSGIFLPIYPNITSPIFPSAYWKCNFPIVCLLGLLVVWLVCWLVSRSVIMS